MAQNIDGINGGAVCNIEGRPSESGGLMEGNNKALKKGPWTPAEDQILIDCVRKHGEGNWNSLRRNSRLNRCGKSCRLRWANHLHPNLKKGAFTPEEERLILQLHAKYGNKWARMASQLPGRTDNEIKNYWNTRVKRRQRKGLPQYPHDIKQSHSQPTNPSIPIGLTQPATTTIPPTVPSLCFPFHTSSSQTHLPPISTNPSHQSPALSSSHQTEFTLNHSLPLFDPATSSFSTSVPSFTFHRPTPMLGSPLGYRQYRENVGFSPPISPTPKRSSSILRTSSMPDVVSYQQFAASTNSMPDMSSFQFQPRSFNEYLVPFPGTSTQIDFGDSFFIESELPSCKLSQTPEPISSQVSQTQSLSGIIIDGNMNATAAMATNETHCTSNWFLEELLQEAEALNNSLLVTQYAEMNPIQDHENEMSMPEDLSKKSNFISSTEPVSHWYSSDIGDLSNSQSSGVTDTSLKFDMQQRMASIVASIDNDRVPHSWDNLPETPMEIWRQRLRKRVEVRLSISCQNSAHQN